MMNIIFCSYAKFLNALPDRNCWEFAIYEYKKKTVLS